MEKNTSLNINQPAQNVPLSPANEELISRWLITHRKRAWMLAFCLLPLLVFTAISYFVFPDVIWVGELVLITVFAPFFIWKPVATLLQNAKIKSALRKGIKKVTTGPLQNLEAGVNFPLRSFLLYTINNSTIKVWAPFGSAIERNGYLKQAQVRLEVLPLSERKNIILAICYVDIPQASIFTEPVSTTDKKPTRLGKKGIIILLCILGLWGIILALSSKPALVFTISLLIIASLVYLVVLGAVLTHRIQKCDQKTSVTGIITEVILFNDDESNTKRYWYRVGNELFDGGTAYNSFMLKDKVCFSYLANKNGEPEDIIDAVKID